MSIFWPRNCTFGALESTVRVLWTTPVGPKSTQSGVATATDPETRNAATVTSLNRCIWIPPSPDDQPLRRQIWNGSRTARVSHPCPIQFSSRRKSVTSYSHYKSICRTNIFPIVQTIPKTISTQYLIFSSRAISSEAFGCKCEILKHTTRTLNAEPVRALNRIPERKRQERSRGSTRTR